MILDNRTLGPEERMGEEESFKDWQTRITIQETARMLDNLECNAELFPAGMLNSAKFLVYCIEECKHPDLVSWKLFLTENNQL